MVVSLYICEIPSDVTKNDIDNIFSEIEGYIETRTKEANDKRTIAFIDYQDENCARCARDTLQGFKFADKDKGLIIKISDNNKNGICQDNNNKRGAQRKGSNDRQGKDNERFTRNKRYRNESSSPSDHYDHLKEKSYHRKDKYEDHHDSYHDKHSHHRNKDYNTTTPNINPSVIPVNPPVNLNANANALLLNALNIVNQSNNLNIPQFNSIPYQPLQEEMSEQDDIEEYDHSFRYYKENIKGTATNIVYVEGMPYGTTEREVSHLFRPFPGFLDVRLITRVKNNEKTLLCFADFENVNQSTICINTLQGYRFDKSDLVGLHFSYGVSKHKK